MDEPGMVGRDEELGLVQAFVADVALGPSALLLAGEAGIGKTILWKAGVEMAHRRYGRVLTCRGVEAEASMSFAGLSELLAPVFDEAAPSLAPPRRRALEVALLLVEPGDSIPDAHAIGLAVLDVLRVQAERGPVVVAIDDLHQLDPASAAVLKVAFRRLRAEPIGVLVTVRGAAGHSIPIALDDCFAAERLRRLVVGPLSLGALHHLLKNQLALDLARPELVHLEAATRGNAFFALELGRELVRTNTRPTAGRALRVPDNLRELLVARLARLPTDTGDVLLQVAALARPTVELVVAVHGERGRVLDALDAAVREGVVELDDSRVRFSHPLQASICYEQAPLWKRRATHRSLAWAVTDVEERARHLALAAEGPDAAVASELEAAAETAAARGAPAAGAELSELAAELTPADSTLARKRRMRAATLHRLAGNRERTTAMLEHLRVDVPPGPERADVLFELASALSADPETMIELCEEALGEVADDDARCPRILSTRTWARLFAADANAALVDARAALARAERTGDPTLLAVALCSVGQAEMWAADVTPGLLERGADIEERHGLVLEHMESPRAALARLLMRRGEIERARAIYEEIEAKAAVRGDERSHVLALWLLGMLEWLAGRWQRALLYGAAADELAEQTQTGLERAWVGRMKALVEADLGLVDEARTSAKQGLAFAEAVSNDYYAITIAGVLGRLELALGNLEVAGDYLRELPGRLLSRGFNDPTVPVWADAIETQVALGELEPARGYLEQYEHSARHHGSTWAVAAASRCRGLLCAADGDLDGSLAAFERALIEPGGLVYPFERGRTLLCLGGVRRRAQQKGPARAALEEALAIFDELGARLWADRARDELRRISGRRPAPEGLTETEHQVAALAARGRSNKEIAAALFIGVSTVEAHLSHVYRKLGVRRAELAARLPTSSDAAANSRDEATQT